MRLRRLGPAHKTATFAVLHLAIAVSLGWLITGSLVLAGLITLIEPALNTGAHAAIDRFWSRRHGDAPSLRKTALFTAVHFGNAVVVAWLLTGSLAVAGALALIEPLANAVALYLFDRWWSRQPAPAVEAATSAMPMPMPMPMPMAAAPAPAAATTPAAAT
jgi:uncharacterized membrane protein